MNARAPAVVSACGLAGALLLGGCSGDDEPDAAPPAPSGVATPGTGPSCSDAAGDSADPVLDLTAVRLTRTGKQISVAIEESGYPPEDREVNWVIGFVSADGSKSVELTVRVAQGGDPSHAVVTDDDSRGVVSPVRITPTGLATIFPIKAVDALGPRARWYVTLSVDGSDIDFCPGGAELRDALDVVPIELPVSW